MEDKNQTGTFSYTYSAEEQAELKRIREKYVKATDEVESKIERLRKLDMSVIQRATAVSLIFGIIGTLILGFGMSLVMTDLGDSLGLSFGVSTFIGVSIGLGGGVIVALAYPVYNLVLKRERARVAPEIIRLSDELMK